MYKYYTVKYEHYEDYHCVDIQSNRVQAAGYRFTLQSATECLREMTPEYPSKEKITNARNVLRKKINELEHQAKSFLGPGSAWEFKFCTALSVMDTAFDNEDDDKTLPSVKALLANPNEFHRIYKELRDVDAEIDKIDRWNLNDADMTEEEYFEFRQILSDALPHLKP